MSNYDVTVRLTTVGTADLAASMKTAQGSMQGVATQLDGTNVNVTRMSTTVRGVTADGDKYSISMKQAADSTKNLGSSAEALSGAMGVVTAAFAMATAGIAAGLAAVYEAYHKLIEPGLEFNSFLEMNRLALGAMQLTFGQYVDAEGNAVNQTRQWSDATAQATENQQLLIKQSLSSAVSIQDLAKTFQMMYGAMLAGGAKSQQEMVTFAGVTADMAAVMGTSYERAARQMTLALLGVTRTTGQLGAMLRSMGIDNATLKSWRDSGTIVEELTAKLHAFVEMQPMLQTTWIGITTNMKTAWQQLTGALSGDVFTNLKTAMNELLHSILDFDTGKLQTNVANMAAALGAGVSGAFGVAVTTIKTILGVINDDLESSGGSWLSFFKSTADLMVFLVENAGKAMLVLVEAVLDPVDTISLAIRKIEESSLSFLADVARGVSLLAAIPGSPVDATVGVAAGTFAAQVDQGVAAMKTLDALSNPVAQHLSAGFAAIDASVLKAYQDIDKVGTALPGVTAKPGDTYVPNKKEVDTSKWDAAIQKYQEFIALATAKMDTSGLSGLDLALAKNEEAWIREDNAITNAQEAIDKAAKAAGRSAAPYDAFSATLRAMNDDAKKLADTKTFDEYALKFSDALSKMDAVAANDTALDKVEATWKTNLRKINDDYAAAVKALGAEPMVDFWNDDKSMAAAMKYYNNIDALDAARTAAMKRNNEQRALNENKILAEQTGNYAAYYAAIVQMDLNAGMTMFQAEQDAAKKAATMLYAQADTAAKGWAAGLAKISESIKSFGQDVADLMTGVWSSMTTAFDTGFYDVLSGKLSDLSNVLKSLWDSILKDFSKMLTQMLERWLLTGDAMGSGQGTGGVLGGLLGGGSNAVYTPGGTANQGGGWQEGGTGFVGPTQYGPGTYYQGGGYESGSGNQGSLAGYAGLAGGVAGIGYGLYSGISALSQPKETYQPTYQGQNVPYSGNFGGTGGGAEIGAAAAVAAGTLVAAQAAVTVGLLTAAAASAATVAGLVVAAVLVVVAALMYIFSGPAEEHVKVAVADAMKKGGATTVVGSFIDSIFSTTTDYVGGLALRAGANVGDYVSSYRKYLSDALGKSTFDIAAGSKDDLQKDVQAFFDQILPKLSLQAAFGQVGVGQPSGNRDATGGIGGLNWNTNNGSMDASGNFIKQQLYDPNAPIPKMLAGLGFTADSIAAIATKLSTSTDIKVFETWLSDLVGIVVDFGALATKFGQTTQQWFDSLHTTQAQMGTAAQFAPDITNLTAGGELLATMFGDDRVAAAKQLVTDGQTLLTNMATALANILQFIDTIKTSTATMIQTYQEKIKTTAEQESDLRAKATADYAAISAAANPKDAQAAWQAVQTDMGQLLDIIVARINAIKTLQQSYADFRTQMATDAGPQFATDPSGWLASNMADINAVKIALQTATGDVAVADAQKLLTLVQQRYANEMQALATINALIKSIDATSQTSIQNLTMQGMGSNVNGTWTPDVHAQGEYLNQQYNSLMGQLGKATTSDEISSLMGQINSIISQMASQPQDPAHYKESRDILIKMQQDAQNSADAMLKTMKDALTTDLKGIGDQLKAGEDALAKALTAASWDFTQALHNMQLASDAATLALTGFADGLTTAMNNLVTAITTWIAFFTQNPTGTVPGVGTPAGTTWVDDPSDPNYQIEVDSKGAPTGNRRRKPNPNPSPKPSPSPSSYTAPVTDQTTQTTQTTMTQPPTTTTPFTGVSDQLKAAEKVLAAELIAAATVEDNLIKLFSVDVQTVQAQMDAVLKSMMPEKQKAITPTAIPMPYSPPSVASITHSAATINVNVGVTSGAPEDVAQAAAEAVYGKVLSAVQADNVGLISKLRNNKLLLAPRTGNGR